MKKKNQTFAFILFFLILILIFIFFSKGKEMNSKKVHILTEPVIVNSLNSSSGKGNYYMIPKGTAVYDDSDSMNRRVLVYFNVVGDVRLDFKDQEGGIDIQPSEMEKIDVLMIEKILNKVKLNREDIKDIIDNDLSVNDDVKALLYKKYKIEDD